MKNGWTRVITFTYAQEALLAKAFLEAFEITVILQDTLTIQVHHYLSQAIGGVKLFVEDNQVEEALLLLEDGGYIEKNIPKKAWIVDRFPPEYKDICPCCNSTNVVVNKTAGWVFILSLLFLSFPIPFVARRVYYCFDCSKEWKIRREPESADDI